ncbi:MAG: hypothetical protein E7173_03600 [Firmicutes bacterium]|nr:hypothetical protein [Bacillota bacterium]
MANKVMYNGKSYDILDAITISDRNYLIIVDEQNINNITYLESLFVNGEEKYSLPPKNFDVVNNPNLDLKRLQINFVVTTVVNILRTNQEFTSKEELLKKIQQIKIFILTDAKVNQVLDEEVGLDIDNFNRMKEFLEQYLTEQLTNKPKEQYTYLDRPIQTEDGLDYEWLYDLDLQQLKELAGSKDRTSGELIYILDALDKRANLDKALANYTDIGHLSSMQKHDSKAAFIDIVLLSLITISFSLLLLVSVF